MLNLDRTIKLRSLGLLPGFSGFQDSYPETQESRTPGMKLENRRVLPGTPGIQDILQGIEDFPGSQTLGMLKS